MSNSHSQIPFNQNTNTIGPATVNWSEPRELPGVLSKWSKYIYAITDTPNLYARDLINGFEKFDATQNYLFAGVRLSEDGSIQNAGNAKGDPTKEPFIAGLDYPGFVLPLEPELIESKRRELLGYNDIEIQSNSETIGSESETCDKPGIDDHIRKLEDSTDVKDRRQYVEVLIYNHELTQARHSFIRGRCKNIHCLGDRAPVYDNPRDLYDYCNDQLPNPEGSIKEAIDINIIWGEHNTLCEHVESILDKEDIEYYILKTARDKHTNKSTYESLPPSVIRKTIRTYRPDMSKLQSQQHSNTETSDSKVLQIELENVGIGEFVRDLKYPHTNEQDMESIKEYYKRRSIQDQTVNRARNLQIQA